MIAYDCENCGKPLMVPDSKGGTMSSCPGCHMGQLVPAVVRSRLRRLPWVKLFFLAIILLAGLTYWTVRLWQSHLADLLQKEFALILLENSPSWGEIEWRQCDLIRGNYRVAARYTSGQSSHGFDATSLNAGDQSSIQIDPRPDGVLGYAFITKGQLQAFDYYGQDPNEQQSLSNLALDLDHALSQAIERIRGK